ncbi:MAG: toxin [Candidatus Omnitrophica bacterium]|nr:toxin [Candidatus Omnitrophota bacterium]
MEGLRWNPLKNEWLRIARGASFSDLTDNGTFLGTRHHPTRPNQQIMLFEYQGRVWAVPFVRSREGNFLKTLYPSRKYTRLHRRGELI